MFSTWLEASLDLARRWESAQAKLSVGPLPEFDVAIPATAFPRRRLRVVSPPSLFTRLLAVDPATTARPPTAGPWNGQAI